MQEQETMLDTLLQGSAATSEFKRAIQVFEGGLETDLIKYSSGSPRIKVLRVLMKLLETFPDKAISQVSIEGSSSCSNYQGVLTFGPDNEQVAFNWDCYWKAEQEGMMAFYGLPDQSKAAQTFGYQCFKKFEPLSSK